MCHSQRRSKFPGFSASLDRCLVMLAAARTADAKTRPGLDAELEVLREELRVRLGPRKRLATH